MKLRTKFAIVILLITLVLSGTVYGGLELYKTQLVSQEQDDVQQTAELTADQLDAEIADRQDLVGYVASRPEAAQFDQSDVFLEQFVDNTRFFAVQLVAANGTIIDFHGDVTQDLREESIGQDVSQRSYVKTALAGELYVSDPEYVNATDRYLLIFSAPVFEDRELKGVLVAAIYVDDQTLFGVLSPISRADQRVVVTTGNATIYDQGPRFAQSLQASQTLDSTGWTVTVIRDRSGLVSQLRWLAIAQGFGLLFIMLAIVGFGVWEYQTTLGQAEQLLDAFSALERGGFEYRLDLSAAEEWEQISDGFNHLAESLAARDAQLREREQRLQVLNRVLRHNLRNTASIILGYAGEIRRQGTDDVVGMAAASIHEAGENLETLSEKARQLEFTVAEREDPEPMDVAAIVEEVLAELAEEYPEVWVNADLPESAWAVADPSLRMAVKNLCENACVHNETDDLWLDVSMEWGPDLLTIEVADNGGGIPEHELSVIRAGEETPLEHGSGLGLWVAQWAIERSGGTLSFDVEEGVGSTATIRLESAEPPGSEPWPTPDDAG